MLRTAATSLLLLTASLGHAVTLTTTPAGLTLKADGVNYATPTTLDWTPGSTHTIEAPSPQPAPNGLTRYTFALWNDSGAQSHEITVSSTDDTFNATYTTEHQLTLTATPPTTGSITASPNQTWHFQNTTVELNATPAEGYRLLNWQGTSSSSGNTAQVTMDQPRSITATFVPIDLPAFTVTTHYPDLVGSGYVFLTVTDTSEDGAYYVMIVDNQGTPVWYRKIPNHIYDFKLLPNGLLHYAEFYHTHSWTGGGDVYHRIVDANQNDIETIVGGNRYNADGHDFQLLPNGNVLQLAYYKSQMDLASLIPAAYPNALVAGALIQELDSNRNVIWQWRTWDHYEFSTYYGPILQTMPIALRPVVDSFHLNTVSLDYDQNILFSNYMMDVQKLNRSTGEVMWRIGGLGNQFSFIGTTFFEGRQHFSACHTPTRLPNGNILLFANADQQATRSAKVCEYALDETNHTATLVWSYAPPANLYSWHYGSAQRLQNGNTFIGWGGANIMPGVGGITNQPVPACTEVTPAGQVVFEMKFKNPQTYSYRAYRFDWPATNRTDALEVELTSGSTIHFGDTGISMLILSGGGGYNECRVSRQPYAPVNPLFVTTAPDILPLRFQIDAALIPSLQATVYLDTTTINHPNPANLTLYHRPQSGQGLFIPQSTQYDPAQQTLSTTLSFNSNGGDFGEIILGQPNAAHLPLPPLIAQTQNDPGTQTTEVIAPLLASQIDPSPINQELPVYLSWSPQGFAGYYELEIATNPEFTNPVVSEPFLLNAYYSWNSHQPNSTYYYRVRTTNDGGTSDWATNAFTTSPPFLQITNPTTRTHWRLSSTHSIEWSDNISEPVTISLHQNDTLVMNLATNASNGAYRWIIPPDLTPAPNYSIHITSTTHPSLTTASALLSIVDATSIIADSVTRSPDGSVQFIIQAPGASQVTVLASPTLSPAAWETIATLPVTNNQASFTDTPTPSTRRYYSITTP
jgi:hypothetical protein